MIVTKDTIQGDYAEKYDVGIAISNCNNLTDELKTFAKKDYLAYSKRCDDLLREFMNDQHEFVEAIKRFINR